MEAKGEISMRMVHCEDCGKRYDYDVDGFCPRCGAFNQPVWVRSGGTAAAAESPAAQQKRTGRLQRELGENLRQAEMAMGRLLKEVPRSTAARRGLVSARQQSKGGNICEEDFLRFVRQTV